MHPLLLAIAATLPIAASSAQSLPKVTEVEPQPALAQATRVREALTRIGAGLPAAVADRLRALQDAAPSAAVTAAIQDLLDPYCLAMVEINPEARVKVRRGPAEPILHQQGWRCFLVKVHNLAGMRSALQVSSPNAQPRLHEASNDHRVRPANRLTPGQVANRFLEAVIYRARPMQPDLSGLALEYAILQLYTTDAGQREVKLGFHAGAGTADLADRNAIDVLFDCKPATRLVLRVQDETGKPCFAAFTITDGIERFAADAKRPLAMDYRQRHALSQPWDQGGPVPFQRLHGVYPLPGRRVASQGYPDFFFQPQVYRTDGESVMLPPGKYRVRVSRGPEYLQQEREIVIPAGRETVEARFELRRWIHLKQRGWYSVDHHVHAAGCSHYESPQEGVSPEAMWRQALGEDLNVACVLSWGPCWYFQKEFFEGKTHALSTDDYLLRYDVEVSGFPSSHAGHICLLRLREDDYPGTQEVKQWPSWTLPVLQWAKRQGGVTGYAHSGWGLDPVRPTAELPNYVPAKFNGIGANEYIVTVTHGAVDFLSAGDTPWPWELNIWYHTLNIGYRTRISGETDFPCIFDERVGMARSYVKIDGKLTFDKAVDGIAKGRCYVSEGRAHIVDFRVGDVALDGAAPELQLAKPGKVPVRATVAALLPAEQDQLGAYIAARQPAQQPYWDIERARAGTSREVTVALIVNGQVAGRQRMPADGSWREVAFEADLARSSWVALRIDYACHTNPIFVTVAGQPIRASRRSAEWCRQGVDRCWAMKRRAIREQGGERAAAKQAYDAARAAYDRLIGECHDDR